MGSKRAMLRNGLGHLLDTAVADCDRFVDLFCGSGAVSAHVASQHWRAVIANDLQHYAAVLTRAQIERTHAFAAHKVFESWKLRSMAWLDMDDCFDKGKRIRHDADVNKDSSARKFVLATRRFCSSVPDRYAITRAYGGHYFSAQQAMAIDSLRATVLSNSAQTPCVAALIEAASNCAASPGHTAQPFSPTSSALPHLLHAWNKDMHLSTAATLDSLSRCVARVPGHASVQGALEASLDLRETDLVFVDPPYSEVQYSRFYHVLEAVAKGAVSDVSGVGRYPAISQRPQSKFCRRTESSEAFNELMMSVAASGASAIVTFPSSTASNGLSGECVEALSSQYFQVARKEVSSQFSTLGGNNSNRQARRNTSELILHLTPR